jgi:uncharacterized delta-60 repeat protein
LQSDGKILAAGGASFNSDNRFALTRYTPNGSLDTSFGSGGIVTTKVGTSGGARGVGVQSDGKIVLGGSADFTGTSPQFAVTRYTATGTLDTTYGNHGVARSNFAYDSRAFAMAIQPSDGKILVGGTMFQTSTYAYDTLARFNVDGSLDTSFGSGGMVTDFGAWEAQVDGIAIQPDGKIITVGGVGPNDLAVQMTLVRYNPDGTRDTSFGAAQTGVVMVPKIAGAHHTEGMSVVIQPDGKIVAAGWAWMFGYGQWVVSRLNSDGSLDTTFGSGGTVATLIGNIGPWAGPSVSLQTDGKIVVAGTSHPAQDTYNFAVARYNTDGSLDTTFNGTGTFSTLIGSSSNAYAMVIQPADGKIVVVGDATVGSAGEFAVARLLASTLQIGSFTASANPVPAGTSETLTVSNITDINPSATITLVAIYLDSNGDGMLEPGSDQLLGYANQTSPGVWTLTSSNAFGLTAGTYRLFAQAQDNYGALSDADALTLTVARGIVLSPTTLAAATAGASYSATITAGGGTAPYTFAVTAGSLPAGLTLSSDGVLSGTPTATGSSSFTVAATDTNSDTGSESYTLTVNPGPAATFRVTGFPSPTTAGMAGTLTLTAVDAYGNTATGYAGTIHFSSTDPQAVLPSDYTFTSSDAGRHTFSVTFQTAGSQSLTATDTTDNSVAGSQTGITVTPAIAASLALSDVPSTTAGTAFRVTLTAKDAYGNTATAYAGTVHFSSSDPQAVLPANYSFTSADQGQHTFSATLETAGSQVLTATDTANSSFTVSDTGITVTPAAAASFVWSSVPTSTTAGSGFMVTVTAKDAYGNIATAYAGTVHFSSSDPQAVLPANYSFTGVDRGVRSFSVTLQTAGSQSLTATDTMMGSLTSSASGIVVNSTFAESLVLSSVPASTTAGSAFTLTVTAEDAYGNTATSYSGAIHFTSSDPQAVLPTDYTFTSGDAGRHTFLVMLETTGSQALTAADTVKDWIWGRETEILVNPAPGGGTSSGGSGGVGNGGSAASGGSEGGASGAVSSGGLSSSFPTPVRQSAGLLGLALEEFELTLDSYLAFLFSMTGQPNQQFKDPIPNLLTAISKDPLYGTLMGTYALLFGYEAATSIG